MKIKANEFSVVIQDILDDYSDDVMDASAEAVEETAKEARKKLRQSSTSVYGSGKYSRGWQYKLKRGRLSNSATVYNGGKHGSLSHLLENGHALRNGGRWNPPRKHIQPVNDEMQEEFVRKVKNKL